MRLSSKQIERFYRIWFALLRFVNDQRQLVPAFPAREQEAALSPADEMQLRNVLWADETLLEHFIATNPAGLSSPDLAIVASWRSRLGGGFFVVRALKNYTVFLSDHAPYHAYGVLGLLRSIEEAVGLSLPFYTQAVLLPFEGQITYDGLLHSYAASFGPGIRRRLTEAYRNAQEREGIITSLVPAASASVHEQRAQVEGRNAKLLQVFRQHLIQAGLSLKMVEQHVRTIEAFAQAVLVSQDPPRGLLELTPADLQAYLRATRTKTTATSFKRFVRFLVETGRMEDEQTEALRQVLKQM
jgi:hypothetical protein